MIDRHIGRAQPTFDITGVPDKYISLITRRGTLARIMRARKCPCLTQTGSPNIFCEMCRGDGYIFDFQRKLLQIDEDSEVFGDRTIIHPFRIPVLEPVSVERLLYTKQDDIKKYTIESFDSQSIKISGNPLPFHWHKMRVSYYFDRYNSEKSDIVGVDPATKTLITTKTKYNARHRVGNVENVHGDITIITRIYDRQLNHEFKNYTFRKNVVQLTNSEPTPTPGMVEMDYFYAPPAFVLTSDIDTIDDKERWMSSMSSGNVRMSVEPWFELSEGDLITLLATEFFRDTITVHSSVGIDKLHEFDISKIDDEIIDEDGVKYRKGIDFYLRPFRDIIWIGNQPDAGKKISIRFGYHPTFTFFMNNPIPNKLENKGYPITFFAKYFSMTLAKDIEIKTAPEYAPETSDPKPIPTGFTDL